MQVMFRSGQELVKVGEIGESIVEADCAFRLEIVRAVLAELRSGWEQLPLRNATGLKHPARGLSVVKQSMHDRAMRCAESRAYAKNLKVDAEIDAWGIQLKCLEQEKIRGGIAGPSMQVDIDGVKSRMKALQMLKAHHLQEAQEEALGKAADNIDSFVRDEYVRVSELAAWLRAEHGVDCQSYAAAEGMAALSTSPDGQIAQMLAGWFDSPIDNLPPKLQEIAEAYIPNWPELSGADRRVQADEVDRQRQDALAAKFEKYRREAEQANAATPDRFKEREFQDGFNRVQRIKNGERDFEAKLGAVNLSHERCIELGLSRELRIADWIELTGVGRGWCGAYLITKEGVSFREWDDDHISASPLDWQSDMERDNEQPPLKFPCTPIELLHFVDTARHDLYSFSVPDAFRRAMIAIEKATDTAPQVPDEAQEQTATSGATEVTLDGNHGPGEAATQASNAMEAFRRAVLASEHSTDVAAEAIEQVSQDQGCKPSEANPEDEVLAKKADESGDAGAPVSSEVARQNRQEHDIAAERGCRRIILEHWDTIEKLHGPRAKGSQVRRFLRNQPDNREGEPSLKTIQNRLIDLRKQKLIP